MIFAIKALISLGIFSIIMSLLAFLLFGKTKNEASKSKTPKAHPTERGETKTWKI